MTFRKHVVSYIALLVAGGLLSAGCGGKDSPTGPTTTPQPPPPPPPSVASIVVNPSSASLVVGGTQRFTASARASDGSTIGGVNITWTSSNNAVVTINASGLATAVSAGTAMIRAMGNGISSTQVAITVTIPPVASVTVSPSSAQQMNVGDSRTFSAMARTAGGAIRGDLEITWSSSDTAVVTINSSGVAMAVGAGMATIRASADGVSSTPVTITVSEPPPPPPMVAAVMVSPSEASIEESQTQQFEAMAATVDGMAIADVEFTWTSSDDNVATVSSMGLATGVSAGEVMITATVGDVSDTAMLTVTEPPPPPPPVVATVMVSPMEASIEEGQTQQFEAMAATADGLVIPDVEFTWTSSDDGVATVDQSGLALGVGAGEVSITVTADDISGTAMLTVTEPPPPPPMVASVSVTPPTASIEEGDTQQFIAVATAADGMFIPDAPITWVSSDESVATISTNGLATGADAGEVTITATAGGVSGMAMLTVTEPSPPPPPVVASVMVSPTEASIEEGQTQQFEAMAATADGMGIPDVEFTWMSSDDGVATVDLSGLATGISAGEATITATADGISGTAVLTVTEPPPPPPMVANVTVTPPTASIEEGDTQQFDAVAMTVEGIVIPGVEFTWTSSDETVATVDASGLAIGVGAGAVTITATAGEISDTAMLTVTEPPPVIAEVSVSPPEASIEEGQVQQFDAVAMTVEGIVIPGVEFTWTSSDETVASIISTGFATGVDAGIVIITATVDSVSGTAELTVTEPPPVVATVMVSPPEASIEEGQSQQYNAVALTPENIVIPGVEFTWASSDETVATVSATGSAMGVGAGTVTIRATTDSVSGTSTLVVTKPPPVVATVMVSPPEALIEEGQKQQFNAVATTAEGMVIPSVDFTWTSSRLNVATVTSSGLATGRNAGMSTIKATVDGVSGMAFLTVTEPPPVVATVTVNPSTVSIEEGSNQQFSATARTMDNSVIPGVNFTWSSGDPNVATINASGLATAVSAGSTQVMATAEGKSGSATLMVTEPPARRSSMFRGATGYRTSGTVILEQDSAGKLVLKFGSDFKVARAPDIWVILYSSDNINYSRRRPPPAGTYENLGEVKANSGTQTYDVPSHVQLDTYDYVIIHCIAFNSEVGIAELQP